MFQEDGIWIIKLHRDSGQEAVYSLVIGELRPDNSTYNYGSQSLIWKSSYSRIHGDYDISPHNQWLETKDIYEGVLLEEIIPITEKEGIQRSKKAQEGAAFMEVFNQAKDEFSKSKSTHLWFD